MYSLPGSKTVVILAFIAKKEKKSLFSAEQQYLQHPKPSRQQEISMVIQTIKRGKCEVISFNNEKKKKKKSQLQSIRNTHLSLAIFWLFYMVVLPYSSMMHAHFYMKILKFLVGYFWVVHSNFLSMQHLFKSEYNCLELLRRRWITWAHWI